MSKEDMINEIDKSIDEEIFIDEKRQPESDVKTSIGAKLYYCRKVLHFTRKEMADILKSVQAHFQITKRMYLLRR